MRTLILIAALLVSAAGLAEPTQALNATAQIGPSGTATIALFGTWQMQVAPKYTQMTAINKRALALLRAGKLDVETARAIHDKSIEARGLLDQSWRADKLDPTPVQRLQLHYATKIIDEAAELLKEPKP